MKYKWCVDSYGWKWLMPKIPPNVVLGTFDLADWVFSSLYTFPWSMYPEKISLVEVILWRLENIFRCLQWRCIFSRSRFVRRAGEKFFGILRGVAWRTADYIATIRG